MIWLLIAAGLVLGVMFWPGGMKAAPNELGSPAEVTLTLRYLLERGVEGGSVRFQIRNDESRQLVLTKYSKARNDVGLRSHISMICQSDRVVEHLIDELSRRGSASPRGARSSTNGS